MDMSKRLKEAVDSGEILIVKYHGGSQPGSIREISPVSIKGNKVIARCHTSNAIKTFSIDKIELVEKNIDSIEITWTKTKENLVNYESLSKFIEEKIEELESLGWHVQYNDMSLTLHKRFKNGKPFKSSYASLDYEEFEYDYIVDPDGEIHKENERKRVRPWVVRSKNINTVTFGKLDKAVILFMEQALALAPNK